MLRCHTMQAIYEEMIYSKGKENLSLWPDLFHIFPKKCVSMRDELYLLLLFATYRSR